MIHAGFINQRKYTEKQVNCGCQISNSNHGNMSKYVIVLTGWLFTFSVIHASDVIVLKDGHGFTGKIKSIRDCTVKFKWNRDILIIPLDQVEYLEFENADDRVALDYLALPPDNKCLLGQQDAEMFHGKYGGHVVLGIFFGPFAMIGTAFAQPYPHRGAHTMAMSKNQALFNDPEYAQCYKRRAKGRLIGAEAIGWGAWIIFWLIINS